MNLRTGSSSWKPPFLPEHHQPHARDRLGHRIDAEDRVGRDRSCALDLEMAQRLEVGDLAATGDQCQRPGQLARVDVPSEMIRDAPETGR
jgi:hypothetical protein